MLALRRIPNERQLPISRRVPFGPLRPSLEPDLTYPCTYAYLGLRGSEMRKFNTHTCATTSCVPRTTRSGNRRDGQPHSRAGAVDRDSSAGREIYTFIAPHPPRKLRPSIT